MYTNKAISIVFLLIILTGSPHFALLTINNVNVELNFKMDIAYNHIKKQLNIGYRIPGTSESRACVKYFISSYNKFDGNSEIYVHEFTIDSIQCQNLLYILNPQEKNIVIFGAHYDSRARASKDENNPHAPVPGANDGASGCAVLLELARCLYQKRQSLQCQVWFVFFDAEDQGFDYDYGIEGWDWCEGSQKFVEDIDNFYDSNAESIDCMILLDMVGGLTLQFIKEQKSNQILLNELFEIGQGLGYIAAFPESSVSASITDDHEAFIKMGVPSADLIINFWDNPHWSFHHTTKDNINHISKNSLEITGRVVEQFMYNNYLNPYSLTYDGYKPWNNSFLSNRLFLLLIIIIPIGLTAIILVLITQIKKKKKTI